LTNRFLHFDNLDMNQPEIVAECSDCGQEFKALPTTGHQRGGSLARNPRRSRAPEDQPVPRGQSRTSDENNATHRGQQFGIRDESTRAESSLDGNAREIR
jgi:hypothetical protein